MPELFEDSDLGRYLLQSYLFSIHLFYSDLSACIDIDSPINLTERSLPYTVFLSVFIVAKMNLNLVLHFKIQEQSFFRRLC